MKRFFIRLALALLLAALALYPLYLVAGNWYLRSGDLEKRLNRRPERLLIQTGSAWTVLPGVIHVRDFRIRNQTRTAQWWASMDRGTFELRLFNLRDRELVITGLKGSGVSFRLRRRVDGREWTRPLRAELQPPVPGLSNPPERPPEKIYPKKQRARRDPWRIRLAQVDLDAVREIWIDEFRFAGEARVAGGFDMTVWHRLTVDPTRLQILSGSIALGAGPEAQPVLARASGKIDGEIAPYIPSEHRGWQMFRFVSGRADVRGTVPSLAFLDEYLRRTRWVRFDTRDGEVAVDLKVRRGRFQPGSRLEARPERLVASALDYRAEGQGRAVWEVLPRGESRLGLEFDAFQLTRGSREPHVRGRNLRIEARNGEPRLVERDFFSPRRIEIEMPASEVKDFSFYNAYLPSRSGLRLTGGSGRMSLSFRAAAPDWTGSGDLRLDVRGVGARFEGRPMRGDLSVHTRIRQADFRGRRFDVSGTKVDLTRVSVAGATGGDWWARAHLDRAVIEPGAPVFLHAKVESTLSDPRPLFAFAAPETRDRVLRWMDDLMTQGVGAVADVSVGDGAVAIDDLAVSGGKASIQGRLRFGGAPKQGLLYASYGQWDVGVELDGARRDWKILRPRKWFENQMGGDGRISGR